MGTIDLTTGLVSPIVTAFSYPGGLVFVNTCSNAVAGGESHCEGENGDNQDQLFDQPSYFWGGTSVAGAGGGGSGRRRCSSCHCFSVSTTRSFRLSSESVRVRSLRASINLPIA